MSGDEPVEMKLRDLNCVLTCRLCNGYLIDATTITECLHTFCRSCILNYLDQDHRGSGGNNGDKAGNIKCPTCDTLIHESQPKQHIVSDSTMDEIVMKLVPGLRDRELRREEEFYVRKNLKWPKAEMLAKKRKTVCASTIINGEGSQNAFEESNGSSRASQRNASQDGQNVTAATDTSGNDSIDELEEDEEEEGKTYHREDVQIRFILEPARDENSLKSLQHKYVLCSEHTPVSVIKKVVCKQLGLTSPNQIDLTCDGSRLGKDHSMKFVFITRWRGRKEHLLINYKMAEYT